MITIDQYRQAERELKKLNAEDTALREQQDKERNALRDKYWKLERNLSDKKGNEEDKLTKRHEKEKEKISKQEQPHVTITNEHSRIMTMMDTSKDYKKPEFKVYKFDYPRDEKGEVIRVQRGNCLDYPDKIEIPYTPIDTIKDDKYAKIQIFITDNGKPKNKFSLSVAGHTIFPEKIIKPPYNYGYNFNTYYTNIIMNMADRPTKEELKAYYERNKKGILKQFLEELEKVEQEYENIIANTDNKQWEIAYWNDKKDYYENHYLGGTEQPEYKQALEKLSELGVIKK